ncbi:MAG: amidohydrolase family protein [Acidobacteriota bacterium]
MLWRRAVLTCALLIPAAGVLAQRPARPPATLLVHNVTLIDGNGGPPRLGADVFVRVGGIAALAKPDSETPAETIDGTGLFLLPGLIDAHVHLSGDTFAGAAATLKKALQGGVTTVFDVAGDTRETSDLARAALAGEISAPTVYYCALFGGPEFMKDPRVIGASLGFTPGEAPWQQAITADTDLVRAIAAAKGTGAQAIKLYAALDADTVRRIGAEAARQHVRLIAHGNVFPARASDLIAAGVKYLAHAAYLVWDAFPPMTDFTRRAFGDFAAVPADNAAMTELLQQMKDHDVALNPTLWVLAEGPGKSDPSGLRTAWSNRFTKRALDMGVTIAAGVDSLLSTSDPLPMIHKEMEMLVTGAHFTPLEAITAATRGAAHGIGVDDARGTVTTGKAADLVLVGADPTVNIRNTRDIRYVIKDGKVVFKK